VVECDFFLFFFFLFPRGSASPQSPLWTSRPCSVLHCSSASTPGASLGFGYIWGLAHGDRCRRGGGTPRDATAPHSNESSPVVPSGVPQPPGEVKPSLHKAFSLCVCTQEHQRGNDEKEKSGVGCKRNVVSVICCSDNKEGHHRTPAGAMIWKTGFLPAAQARAHVRAHSVCFQTFKKKK